METITIKVLDNTFISACITDINSKDLIEICCTNYNLVVSQEVREESLDYSDKALMKKYYEKITVIDMSNSEKYNELLEYLTSRYPNLHKGELSTFLIALLEYELKGKNYFYITDDQGMRKSIEKIKQDSIFSRKLGVNVPNFRFSGTIGLIKRLRARNLLNLSEIEKIIDDLKNGSFYLNPSLIEYLRNES